VIHLSTNQATPAHCMMTLPSMPTNEPPVTYSVFRRLASRCRFSRACPVADCRRWEAFPVTADAPLTRRLSPACRRWSGRTIPLEAAEAAEAVEIIWYCPGGQLDASGALGKILATSRT